MVRVEAQNRSVQLALMITDPPIIKRIVLTGAESTGKSTLAKSLSEHYCAPWSKEFVREYIHTLGRDLIAKDVDTIARGQLAVEDAALDNAQKIVIHDTNIVSTIIYAEYYFGEALTWANSIVPKRGYSLYLLCSPDIPWVADPRQRTSLNARATLHTLFKKRIEKYGYPYLQISGSHPNRLNQAIQAIDCYSGT